MEGAEMMADMTLTNFVAHLAGAAMEISHINHAAMERACLVVEKEAKREVGTYQDGQGQIAGWAELADSTKDDRVRQGYSENDPGLRSGEMRDSIGHAVSENEGVVGSNDEKLVWFELGTSKQPPRSVLALAALHKGEAVAKILGHGMTASLLGKGVHNGSFELIGDE
jgi:hypothetical protein